MSNQAKDEYIPNLLYTANGVEGEDVTNMRLESESYNATRARNAIVVRNRVPRWLLYTNTQ